MLPVHVQENPGKQLWHTPRVPIMGLPEKEHWPKAEQLVSLLRCQPGRPVATQVQLTTQMTEGLFPIAQPLSYLACPLFRSAWLNRKSD